MLRDQADGLTSGTQVTFHPLPSENALCTSHRLFDTAQFRYADEILREQTAHEEKACARGTVSSPADIGSHSDLLRQPCPLWLSC